MSQAPTYDFFSNEVEDRLPEIDLRIIEAMADEPLRAYCLSTQYNIGLCDERFWLQRIKSRGLELLLPYRSLYSSLSAFYFGAQKDACYIVATTDDGTEDAFMFNEPLYAYRKFIELVRIENDIGEPETDEEDEGSYKPLDLTGLVSSYDIYVMFNDVIISRANRSYYIIFNLRPESNSYRNPKIFQYPILQHADILVYYFRDDNVDMGITSLTKDSLRAIPKETTMMILTTRYWDDQPIRWNRFVLGWRTAGYYHIGDGTYSIVLPDDQLYETTILYETPTDTEVLLIPKKVLTFLDNITPLQIVLENRRSFNTALFHSNLLLELNAFGSLRELTDLYKILSNI